MELSITLILVLINVGISLLAFSNGTLYNQLLYNPYLVVHDKQWHRLIGHAFIHVDFIHLLFNMYVLYQFGGLVESIFTREDVFLSIFPGLEFWGAAKGALYFITLYFGGLMAATMPALIKHRDNPGYNSAGASGAVSAIVMASIVLLPTMKLYLFFIPIAIPAFILGGAYLAYEYFMSKRMRTGIAHDAHLLGGLFAVVFMLVLNVQFGFHFLQRIGAYIGW